MISAIHTALSGLTAIGKQIKVIANNIANVNTDGFKKSKQSSSKSRPVGSSLLLRRTTHPGLTVLLRDTGGNQTMVELSNVDLGEEAAQQIAAQRSFEANLQTLRTGDALLGSILDIKK